MGDDGSIEIRFRLSDGSDIGPNKFYPSATVASLKEKILASWPQGKELAPRTIKDLKIINSGKILENTWTLTELRVQAGELPGGVITMHVVVRPPLVDENNGKLLDDESNLKRCGCTIL